MPQKPQIVHLKWLNDMAQELYPNRVVFKKQKDPRAASAMPTPPTPLAHRPCQEAGRGWWRRTLGVLGRPCLPEASAPTPDTWDTSPRSFSFLLARAGPAGRLTFRGPSQAPVTCGPSLPSRKLPHSSIQTPSAAPVTPGMPLPCAAPSGNRFPSHLR